uniref:Uncharacterized protein n=1 Tax=Rhizophora mucronata TaxID=61149 RepID=A0A2P2MHI1_RHIMU
MVQFQLMLPNLNIIPSFLVSPITSIMCIRN